MIGAPVVNRMWGGRGRSVSRSFRRPTSSTFSLPWAVAGMVAAFFGGALLGMMGGKRAATSQGEGERGMWMIRRRKHDSADDLAAPGAAGESEDARNEGE